MLLRHARGKGEAGLHQVCGAKVKAELEMLVLMKGTGTTQGLTEGVSKGHWKHLKLMFVTQKIVHNSVETHLL